MLSKEKNDDYIYVFDNLRASDVDAIKLNRGENWKETLIEQFKDADLRVGYTNDGKPVLVYGVLEEGSIGVIWMLTTDDIVKEQRSFIVGAKEYVQEQVDKYKLICNYVLKADKRAIKWLKSLGFLFLEDPNRTDFLFFYKGDLQCALPAQEKGGK